MNTVAGLIVLAFLLVALRYQYAELRARHEQRSGR